MVGNDRVTTGYYSYFGPDGKIYTVHYTADRFGYRATGSHLPVQEAGPRPLAVQPISPTQGPEFISSTPGPFISSTPGPFISPSPYPSTPGPYRSSSPYPFGSSSPYPSTPGPYRSSSPYPYGSSTPGPFISSTPFVSSTPGPFISSTPAPFISSSPYNSQYSPSTPFVPSPPQYQRPIRPVYNNNIGYSSTTPAPSISSPYPSVSPLPSSNYRPHFPIYSQSTPPFPGYRYTNPRINDQYSHVSQQTPAPIFYSQSREPPINRFSFATAPSNYRVTTTLAPPIAANDLNGFSSTTSSPFDDEPHFKEYIPPIPIVSSTPRPFNSYQPNQPDTVFITPKPFLNQQRLPNSLSINQNLVPPYLAVEPLNSGPGREVFRNDAFNDDQIRADGRPPGVAPVTITNLNYRKK